ncbi:MAG: hypothetical protein GX118_07025 [Arcobacter butzleri]|jgi:uncharacterized metal-binding protein YceD (DUF177 family)|nr:hypothetical protein [Arcobacteraceae bacterium]MDY0364867.1 hypothetical protein [Arcobacteraceae bacterium]NLO17926.1 hypothetical protein [Aliarcobacter butzleri]
MKIEFKKVPFDSKNFQINDINLVKIEGTFCKITQELVKITTNISGSLDTLCSRCGKDMLVDLDENIEFLVSDGIYKGDNLEELDVIESFDNSVDFDEILKSELESIRSDYHICDECLDKQELLEKEF